MIDIVIPAHNEEKTVGQIVSACKAAALGSVIVVADACTDSTALAASSADAVVQIGAHDKGSAMAAGLARVGEPYVLFIDADLSGLTAAHVRALAEVPPMDGQVVGLTESMINRWSKLGLPPISGERRLPTAFARTIRLEGAGYKAELMIDAAVADAGLPHQAYVMAGVTNPSRKASDPVGWASMFGRLGLYSVEHLPALVRYSVTAYGR